MKKNILNQTVSEIIITVDDLRMQNKLLRDYYDKLSPEDFKDLVDYNSNDWKKRIERGLLFNISSVYNSIEIEEPT